MSEYDVIIIGGGITGTAVLYVLSRYTNISRIAMVEKCPQLAQVNSRFSNNSQTLHFGDIETNYDVEKAKAVKEAAMLVARYVESVGKKERIHRKSHKMVLAVGAEEVQSLEQRYEEIKPLFPALQKIGRERLEQIEPNTIKGRSHREKVIAIVSNEGYTINFSALAESFAKHALEEKKEIELLLGEKAIGIKKVDSGYQLTTNKNKLLKAKALVVAAGAHSLIFAKQLGYGKEYGILPVAGNFYCADNILQGKVYRVQVKKLPFAAVHGDPDIINHAETRFGPTIKVLPFLERRNMRTFADFLKTSAWNLSGVASLFKIISDPAVFKYVLTNFLYDWPILGKWFFLQEVRKIVPSLTYSQIHLGKGIGGIRPQVVNIKEKSMEMGEGKIIGDKIIFDITPSPGASVCLKNAEKNARQVIQFLGYDFAFNEQQWKQDFS